MDAKILVEAEIARHPWSSLYEAAGPADRIPDALRALLSAQSSSEIKHAYWRLENHVVVQGQLFESAVATTQVLVAALMAGGLSVSVRGGIIELLFQIVSGESHEDAVSRANHDLGERCRDAVREGNWVLYREMVTGKTIAAREVIEIVEREPERLLAVDRLLVRHGD